jgi:hypothetical protein
VNISLSYGDITQITHALAFHRMALAKDADNVAKRGLVNIAKELLSQIDDIATLEQRLSINMNADKAAR